MALARYFDKAALSAASLLRKSDYDGLRRRLESHTVAVCFDQNAVEASEGRWTLELLVSLLARLYPSLALIPLGPESEAIVEVLAQTATAANALVDVRVGGDATVVIGVGKTLGPAGGPALYVGSDGWKVATSASRPVGSGGTAWPIGAGAAACLAAAWVFRQIFSSELEERGIQSVEGEGLSLSLLDFDSAKVDGRDLPQIVEVGETVLVGVGAIGNGAVWALARTAALRGRVLLVDGERLDLSNVQRYVLASETDEGTAKPMLGAREWRRQAPHGTANAVAVEAVPMHWPDFVSNRRDYRIDRALLALDSAAARIEVQASLPRWIANAWTRPENLGVSRHADFGESPCVACLYKPKGQALNRDQLVADAIGAAGPEELMAVRQMLQSGAPLGEESIDQIADRLGVDPVSLRRFTGASLQAFYSEAVCGGMLLRLGASRGEPAEVPMAFQSAFAGILLAAELIADAAGLRVAQLPTRTQFDLLRPLSSLGLRPHVPESRDAAGTCLCNDPVFLDVYRRKYARAAATDPVGT